jgi:nucleoside-diphosphate-sugar epimerase
MRLLGSNLPLVMPTIYQPKRIALTGATGALGFAFLRDLFMHQPEVRATLLVRCSSPSFATKDFQTWLDRHTDRIKLIDADIRNLSRTQTDALVRTDGGLWHFAAVTSLNARDAEVAKQIDEVNVGGTRHLAEACQRSGHKHPFFHVSTANVLGNRTGLIREEDRFLGQEFRNPYEASKSKAEEIVQQAFAAGVPGAIFRPGVVIDHSGLTGGFKIIDACAFAVARAVGRHEAFVFRLPETADINLVQSDWVIAAMLDLARMPSGPGRTYHLTAPEPTLFRDIGGILSRLVPNLRIQFEPDFLLSDLPNASKLFDKASTELRPYFEASVQFDRTHAARDLSPALRRPSLKLKQFVETRLRVELDQVNERETARARPATGTTA